MRISILLMLMLIPFSAQAADPLLVAQIVICESSSRPDVCGDDGVSCGIVQFRRTTFFEFSAMAIKARKWNFKLLGKPRWMSMKQQIFLLHFAIDRDLGNRWTCFRKLTRSVSALQ